MAVSPRASSWRRPAPGSTIPARPGDGGPTPASPQQLRYWHEYLRRREHGREAIFHSLLPLRLSGPLDAGRLEQAMNTVVARHDALRTRFAMADDMLVQHVEPAAPFALLVQPLPPAATPAVGLQAAIDAFVEEPFDLERDAMCRARLLVIDPSAHVLLVIVHHIVYDGWSMQVLLQELVEAYAGRLSARGPLPIQYADYAHWCTADPARRPSPASLAFWRERLGGAATTPYLPTDRPRPAEQTWAGACHVEPLPVAAANALVSVAEAAGVPVFQAFLALLAVALAHWCSRDDLLIGTPAANRLLPEVEPLIGLFTNLLPLRLRVDQDASLASLVGDVRDTVLEALDHQDVPFDRIAEAAGAAPSPGHHRMVQVVATYAEGAAPVALDAPGPWAEPVDWRLTSTCHFDLTFILRRTGGGLVLDTYYATDLFDPASIEALVGRLATLMTAAGREGAAVTVSRLRCELAGDASPAVCVAQGQRTV